MGRIHAHSSREPGNYRWWISDRKRDYRTLAKGEISWRSRLTGIWIALDSEEPLLGFSLGLYWLYLHLSVRGPRFLMRHEDWEVFQLTFHDGSVWWSIWHSGMGWSSATPRWRRGSWSLVDFLLGKAAPSERLLEERQVLIPMPEKSYPATVKLVERAWKRPRWFRHTWMAADIEIPGGIPHAGKGTASWNCGDDATFGLYTAARNIPEAIGKCVGSCLESRVRYGGWDDYVWKREVLK